MKFKLPKINLVTAVLTAVAVLFTMPTLSKEFVTAATQKQVTVNYNKQVECLAKNIYYEAASEPYEGKLAVAQVTLNRADNPKFPKDVCKVVTQKNVIMEKVVCQFSWYCDGKPQKVPNDEAYRDSYAVAKKVLLEGFRLDSLNDALYYHAVYINPGWQLPIVTRIGNHIFYRSSKI